MKFSGQGTPYSFADEGLSCGARLRGQLPACNANAPSGAAAIAASPAKRVALPLAAQHPARCCVTRIARAGNSAIRP